MPIISMKTERRTVQRLGALAAVLGVGIAALIALQLRGSGPPSTPAASQAMSAPSSAIPTATVAVERAPQATSPTRTAPAVVPPVAALTKAQQFDLLARSDDPADSLKAAKMALSCRANACSDLSPGQLTMSYGLVQRAVAAHVPTASTFLLAYAPDGREFEEAWNDPAYAAWKQNGLDEAAAAALRGDAEAMYYLSQMASLVDDAEKALTYLTAYADKVKLAPKPTAALNPGLVDGLMPIYKARLTPEQIAKATAAGHAIAKGEQQ